MGVFSKDASDGSEVSEGKEGGHDRSMAPLGYFGVVESKEKVAMTNELTGVVKGITSVSPLRTFDF